MEKPLNGIYRVSFDLELEAQDGLSLADVAQSLTEGLGEQLVAKVSELSVEKIEKRSRKGPQVLKIGDMVTLNKQIKIKASFYADDGYIFVGKPSIVSHELGEQEIVLEAGSTGYINKIQDGKAEVIDLDRPIKASFNYEEELVNVDFITLDAEMLDKADIEGDSTNA